MFDDWEGRIEGFRHTYCEKRVDLVVYKIGIRATISVWVSWREELWAALDASRCLGLFLKHFFS